MLIPLLERLGAPGVVLTAAALVDRRGACCSRRPRPRAASRLPARSCSPCRCAGQLAGAAPLRRRRHEGPQGDRVLFSKWNSFSRIGVYDRHARRLVAEPDVHRARCPTRGSWTSIRRPRRRSSTCDRTISSRRAVPALRADRARPITLRSRHSPPGRLHRAGHRSRRRPRPRCRRWSSARRTSTASRSTRSSPTTSCATAFREFSGGIYAHPRVSHRRRRRPQLRAADAASVRRDPGVARRHLGRDRGRRVHADRELALHGRGVQRLPRSPDRRRAC